MLERTEQWNLVSRLIIGILNRKRIESRQDNQDLDAALRIIEQAEIVRQEL